MSESPPTPLAYGRSDQRKNYRRIVLLLLLGGLIVIGFFSYSHRAWIATHWRQYQQMRADRAMMKHTESPDRIVYETGGHGPGINQSPYSPVFAGPVIFLHGRKTSAGVEVVVEIRIVPPRSGHGEHLSVTLYEPAGLNRWTRHHGPDVAYEQAPFVGGPPKKIIAGQADPNDESHFTIEFEIDGQRRVLGGRVVDSPRTSSGATFQLKMMEETGPASQPNH
jgi:hypothetical protein